MAGHAVLARGIGIKVAGLDRLSDLANGFFKGRESILIR